MPPEEKYATSNQLESLARMTEREFGAVRSEIGSVRGEIKEIRETMATKSDLHESEQRLLEAIRNIDIKRQEFEALEREVKDLNERLIIVEKRI